MLQGGVLPWGDSPPQTSLKWVHPWASVLLQCGSPPTGISPSRTGCSSTWPPQSFQSCQQTYSSADFSLHGCTALVWASPGASFRLPLVQHRSPPQAAGGSLCSLVVLRGLQVHSCFTMVCIMGYRRSSALVPELSSALPWWSSSVELTCSHPSVLWPQLLLCSNFFSSLKCVILEAQPWPVVCPSWSRLALALLDLEETSVSFSEAALVGPTVTKTWPYKPNTIWQKERGFRSLKPVKQSCDRNAQTHSQDFRKHCKVCRLPVFPLQKWQLLLVRSDH